MDLLIWTLAGTFAGLLAWQLFGRGVLSELDCVAIGALGGLVGGGLLAPTFGVIERGELGLAGLVVALISPVVALSVLKLHREEA